MFVLFGLFNHSSMEYSSDPAWYADMDLGKMGYGFKNYYVWPVRSDN